MARLKSSRFNVQGSTLDETACLFELLSLNFELSGRLIPYSLLICLMWFVISLLTLIVILSEAKNLVFLKTRDPSLVQGDR
jgi:hypothetical protein